MNGYKRLQQLAQNHTLRLSGLDGDIIIQWYKFWFVFMFLTWKMRYLLLSYVGIILGTCTHIYCFQCHLFIQLILLLFVLEFLVCILSLESPVVCEFENIVHKLGEVKWDVFRGISKPSNYIEKWRILMWDKAFLHIIKNDPHSLNQPSWRVFLMESWLLGAFCTRSNSHLYI